MLGFGFGISVGAGACAAAAPLPGGFDPEVDLVGRTLLLDGDDPAAGLFNTWSDQSGNGNDFSHSLGNQPTGGIAAPNGHFAVDFTDGWCALAGPAISSLISAGEYTLWAVVKVDAFPTDNDPAYANAAVIGTPWTGEHFGLYLKATGTLARIWNDDGAGESADVSIGAAPGTWVLITARHAGGNLYISKDGGAEASVASGDTVALTDTPRLGFGQSWFDGQIAYLAITNNNSAQLADMTSWLKTRYSIA